MLIWGQPGQGKSSLLLLLAHDLSKNGKTLLILREERISSGRVGERAKRLNVAHSSDIILNDAMNINELRILLAKNPSIEFVGVDSLQRWDNVSEDEIEKLIKDFPNVSFVFVAQSNKAGKEYRGFSQLANTVDTVILVKDGVAKTSKHRDSESEQALYIFGKRVVGATTMTRVVGTSTQPILFSGLNL
jgi:predicted ATP-dependent serine protease